MKKLILFTNYYPYYKGEEYLETEIKFLSEEFDDIYLFPTFLSSDMEQTRKVPNNVNVYPITYNDSYVKKIKSLGKALVSKDKEMHLRVKKDAKMNIVRRLYDYYFESRTNESLSQIIEILQTITFDEKDDITLYSYWMHATAKIAVEVKKAFFKEKVAFSFTRAHRYDVDIVASPIGFLPEREYLLDNLDRVYCISSSSQHYLQQTYPEFKEKVSTSRLGTSRRAENAIAENRPYQLVSCSLLRSVKNVDLIVDALAILEEKSNIEIEWTHFGNGPEFEKIKNAVSQKLSRTKTYLPGYVSNKDVLTWYAEKKPSAFINVSSSEGIPVSIMEAMSYGIPVIATDVGGNGEIVENGYNGLLLSEKVSPTEIVEAILTVNQLEEQAYKEYRNHAYKTWQEKYSSDKNYSEFVREISDY